MMPPQDSVINIYTDYRDDRDLALPDIEQKRLDKYVRQLQTILKACTSYQAQISECTPLHPWQQWARSLQELIKEIYYDAFKSKLIPRNGDGGRVNGVELYIAGSLAKSQATPYSDFDGFVLFDDDDAKAKAQPVFAGVNNLLQRIFERRNQLYPDPIGINPARLADTVSGLSEKILEGFEVAQGPTLVSVMTSKPLLGQGHLSQALKEKLLPLVAQVSAKASYHKAIDDFKGPADDAAEIHLKNHLLRPLDFMLMGLRAELAEYFIDDEDGKYLDALRTIEKLSEIPDTDTRKPSYAVRKALKETFIGAMTYRFKQHVTEKREADKVSPSRNIKSMLDNVKKLRSYFTNRASQLDNTLSGHSSKKSDYDNGLYQKRLKKRLTIKRAMAVGFTTVGLLVGTALFATGVGAVLGVTIWAAIAVILAGGLSGLATGLGIYAIGNRIKPTEPIKFKEPSVGNFKAITEHYPQHMRSYDVGAKRLSDSQLSYDRAENVGKPPRVRSLSEGAVSLSNNRHSFLATQKSRSSDLRTQEPVLEPVAGLGFETI